MRFIRQDTLLTDDTSQFEIFDIAFYGQEDIDDRSLHSAALSKSIARRHCRVFYDSVKCTLNVDGWEVRVDNLENLHQRIRAQSIIIDATTLEFPEILYILQAYSMQANRPRCGFFYVEPQSYSERGNSGTSVPSNAFDLSSGFKPGTGLPGYSRMLNSDNQAHLVAFIGFEGDRLMRILNADDGHFYRKVTVVFGVPPFQPNWDLHALMANSSLLEQQSTSVMYCGANNPRAAYVLLSRAHAGMISSPTTRLLVAPFGTKPMALGSALYCLQHQILTPLYDYPIKKQKRTIGVHKSHWYEIGLS
jgi:hypothetical protein